MVTNSDILSSSDRLEALPKLAGWRDYFALLKPRVMSLVVFTALVGFVCAPSNSNPILAVISIFAIALGAGAAGCLNMWYDADIDGLMTRTRMRPIPAGKVQDLEALNMGIIFSILSILLLAISGGYAAAGLLAFTIVFYAVVYSMWLKRSTPMNIVIGGLAGALPPLIAWFAAGGQLSLNAVLPVAIIFMWTPPHSWALALYKAGDYAKAGIPMLPVAKGPKATKLQILLYSIFLVPIGIAPAFTGLGGVIYLVVSSIGGAAFLGLAIRLFASNAGQEDGRSQNGALYTDSAKSNRPARDLFAFSLLYLTSIFATLLIENGFGMLLSFGWEL
jgi:protoheme IX farnesyltransferase